MNDKKDSIKTTRSVKQLLNAVEAPKDMDKVKFLLDEYAEKKVLEQKLAFLTKEVEDIINLPMDDNLIHKFKLKEHIDMLFKMVRKNFN